MIKVSAQTFSTTSWKKSEINMRPSDLCDNLHTRFYKNNYTVRTTQEQIVYKFLGLCFFYVWQKRDFLDTFCKTIYEDNIT